MEGICALCRNKEKLKISHITPKFVTNWIKKTAITGGLRNSKNINKRVEDGFKKELLCEKCENKFSTFESDFAKNIFRPYLEGEKSFKICNKTNKFISSISWRILVTLIKKEGLNKVELKIYEDVEEKLRNYLLDKKENPYNNHFFFFKDKMNYEKPIKEYFWYIDRANDMFIAISQELSFIYFSFPKMFFVTQIIPKDYVFGGEILVEDGEGNFLLDSSSNLVKEEKELENSNLAFLPQTEKFFIERAKKISEQEITNNQKVKVGKLVEKNKEKLLDSESFKTFMKIKKKT